MSIIERALLPALLLVAACAAGTRDEPVATDKYRGIVSDPVRSEADRGMDARRHPVELLEFAHVRPGMQALDIVAGGGYTSQLLALAVAPGGKAWAQSAKPNATLTERLAKQQPTLGLAQRPVDDPVPPGMPPLDLVTLILNYHDISYLPLDRDAMNRRIFEALKPGGFYVVVDHSALPGTGITAGKTLHRIEEAFVVAEVKRAGFVLDGEGSFMRNPADTREGSSNNPTPLSDRFALRFVKPR
jgi:predicted methyltransferase